MPYRYVLVIEHFGKEYCIIVDKSDFDDVISDVSKEHTIHQDFCKCDDYTMVMCFADSLKGRKLGFYYIKNE